MRKTATNGFRVCKVRNDRGRHLPNDDKRTVHRAERRAARRFIDATTAAQPVHEPPSFRDDQRA